MNFLEIHNEAKEAAKKGSEQYIEKYGEQFYPCGFAWVIIHVDGRSPLGKEVRKVCEKNIMGKGYMVWNPSNHSTQNMDVKYSGALEYALVLQKHGIACSANARMD